MKWIKTDDKNSLAKDNPCIVWVWDKDLRIGYCSEDQLYWSGGRWVNEEGKPYTSHRDHSITAYLILPKPKGRKLPVINL